METDRTKARATTLQPEVEAQRKQQILQTSPLAGLADSSRDAVLELGKLEQVPRRTRVAEQGEPAKVLLLLGAGRVKLERVHGDRAFPLGHRGPGQMVGETAIAGGPTATENATVLDDVEAVSLPLAGLKKLLLADAPLRAAMTAALVRQHRATEERLESLLLLGVEARLVWFLLDAVSRWGRPHAAGGLIAAPFTHADVAVLIGSTRETVTLLLGKLKRAGLLAFDRRRVIVPDRAALERYVATL